MIQNTTSETEKKASDLQGKSHLPESQKIKSQRSYRLDLQQNNISSQYIKMIHSHKLILSQRRGAQNDEIFRTFAKSNKRGARTSEKLKIFVNYKTPISNPSLLHISQTLKNLGSLHTIHLHINSWEGITDKGLGCLSQGLQRALGVKTVILCFEYFLNSITDIGFQKVSKALGKLTSIESLTVEIKAADQISSVSLISISKYVKKLKSLASLRLKFDYCQRINGEGLSYLCKNLQSLNLFKSLHIEFIGCASPFSTPELFKFGAILKSLINLKTLNLVFACWDVITDDFFKCLSQSFCAITSLENLGLKFEHSNSMTDAAFQFLSQGLEKLLDLRSIYLFFNFCPKLTDKGIIALSEALGSKQSLNNFKFEFTNCPQIADAGLLSLSQTLSPMKFLQNISLTFSHCKSISDSGVGSITKNLSEIESLGLCFPNCVNITDACLRNMVKDLENLRFLRELCVKFTACTRLSDSGLRDFVQGVKEHPAIKRAKIDMSWRTEITKSIVESLNQELKTVTGKQIDLS